MALPRLASGSVWQDDLPTVRSVGLVSVSAPATASTLVAQLAACLPLGTLSFRLAFASCLALAAASWLLFRFARQLFHTHVSSSALSTPLALLACAGASFTTLMQQQAMIAVDTTLNVALALGVFATLTHSTWTRWQRHALTGALLAVLACNHVLTALVVGLAVLAVTLWRRDWVQGKQRVFVVALSAAVGAAMFAPWPIRAYSPNALWHFGLGMDGYDLAPVDVLQQAGMRFGSWTEQLGPVMVIAGLIGVVLAVTRKRTRWFAVLVLPVLLADTAMPSMLARHSSWLTLDPMTPVRCLALACLSVAMGLAVQAIVTMLQDTGLAMAKAAAVLVLVFHVSIVGMLSERAAFLADPSQGTDGTGAAHFTDEALYKLEPNAMVLVRSDAMLWRLYAERVTGGGRPDVVVVPMTLLGRGDHAARVLAEEPHATMLLRDMALEANVGEHAFATIADKRHLFAEFDPYWQSAVASHLRADGMWLALESQPVSRSERRLAAQRAVKSIDDLLKRLPPAQSSDRATRVVVASVMRQQTLAAARANDRQATHELLAKLQSIAPDDWFLRTMSQRLAFNQDATIDITGLLR